MRFQSSASGRLDRILADALPQHSRSRLAEWIEAGGVKVDDEPAPRANFKVRVGAWIEVEDVPEREAHDLEPYDFPLDVVWEDDQLLVVNKPRGLAVHPAASLREPSLVNALLARPHLLSGVGESWRPGIVHRLDKPTTGLIMIAKTDAAHVSLAAQIKDKTAGRRYYAVIKGGLPSDRMEVRLPLARDPKKPTRMAVVAEGKVAVSHLKQVRNYGAESLVAVRLETGRTHQIRVHLNAINHPVRGDKIYAEGKWGEGAMQLHAAWLAFDHPVTGQRIEVFGAAPEDFSHREQADEATISAWS
jgi:23S rRNA pseudouridine1911/1915/1917 synthase